MDIRRFFDILELDRDATIDEAKRAYKDLVNIWHPDRFSNNPRLRQKAEDKLKEINEAYETVNSFLSSKKPVASEKTPQEKAEDKTETSAKVRAEADYPKSQAETEAKHKTEAFVEAGTGIVLSLLSYLSSAFRRIVAEAKSEIDQGQAKQWQKGDDIRGKGGGRGMGRGRRTGRGKGMGRGGGRGRGRG
jgi:curved DNA-binding protein CbpA